MRKLGNQYIQTGGNKKVRKKPNEIIAELLTVKTNTQKKKLLKKDLAKKLGVTARSLRRYKNYFASLENPAIKLTINDRKPSKKILDKLYKVAKNYKIKTTRQGGNIFDKSEVETLKNVITKKTFTKIKKEILKPNFFGWLIRINIAFISKHGTFNDWLTYVTSIIDYKDLDQFISDQIYKKVTNKNSILGFEIIEVVINVTTKDYEPNKPK